MSVEDTTQTTTRRGLLVTAGSTAASLLVGNAQALQFDVETVFEIPDGTTKRPDSFTYDAIRFEGNGELEFQDGDKFVFGTTNPPVERDPRPSAREIDLHELSLPLAVFLVGMHSFLFGAVAFLRNYAAGIAWGLSLIFLIMAGLFGLGLEIYWMSIISVVVLLIVGMVVRWQA